MAIFRRKTSGSDGAELRLADVEWGLAKSEVDGKPLIVRWDAAAKRRCPDRARPIKVTIGIACVDPRADGLPSSEDLDVFDAIEEAIFSELPRLAGTHPVLVLTANGMREWIAYARSHDWLETWAPTVQERFMKGRPGKVDAVEEPGWETFTEWTPA